MKMIFQTQHFEEHKISDENLIQLKPYGISLMQDPSRPLLLLKDESGQHVLPVNLSPVEAGVAIQQQEKQTGTPHRFTDLLLKSLNVKIERCVFIEIKENLQYVRLFLEGHPSHGSLKIRADEAMSLCLHLNIPFYATAKLMRKSQTMSAELEGLAQGLQINPAVMMKTHEYLI